MNTLRFAFRRLLRSPGFAVTAVVVLGLGIAGNTVVFSFVNALFLKPLPFPQPDQLVDIDETAPKWNLRYAGIKFADFKAWQEHNATFTAMAHFRGGEFGVSVDGRNERLPGQFVTHELADVFGFTPVIGRMFRPDEEFRAGTRVVLIGHHIWQDWFGGDPRVLGRTITVDAQAYEIIGVLPATAVLPSRAALWLPFPASPRQYGGMAIGRLKPGVPLAQAQADLLRIHRARIPEAKDNEVTSPLVQPLLQRQLGSVGSVAFVLESAVVLLLLVACANVAGLVLARTLNRTPELGLRAALGASRTQLVRQLAAESLVVALLGAILGVFLGRWALDAIVSTLPDLPAWMNLEIDARFAAFVCLAVAACAVLAGVLPARHVLGQLDVRRMIGAGAQQASTPRDRIHSLRVLVVAEIALALVLLLVSGLFGRALLRVQRVDPGLRPDHLLTYGLQLPEAGYRGGAARIAFFDQHLARVRSLPDVVSASASTILPFSGQHIGNFFEPEGGLPGGPDAPAPVVLTRTSLPGYLETMGIAVVAGRSFTDQDRRDVVIVNETLAQQFWPGESAIGRRLRSRGGKGPWLEVIGVAHDVRHYGLEDGVRPGIYVPYYAMPQPGVGIVVRTKGEPANMAPAIRTLLREQDATLAVAGLATMEERIRQSLFLRRLYSMLTAIFAGMAVAIAMTGLYGVIAYVVGQRTREFGIRLALGAQARDLLRLVLGEGARLAAIGLSLGLVGGVLSGAALSGFLVGVSPLDPAVLLTTIVLLAATIFCACIIPARRTTQLSVLDVLRAE